MHLPVGVLSFEIHDVGSSPNHAVNVDLLLPAGLSLSSYWVYGRESEDLTYHWYEFLYDDTTGTGADIASGMRKVTLTLVDGARGDDDLAENGVIVHFGGPVAAGGRDKPRINPYRGGVPRPCTS